MTRNHLATIVIALAAVTLAPAWPGAALAQTTFTLGGGVNIASLAVSGDEDTETASVTRLGFEVGVGVPVSEKLGLHLGARYSQKGAVVSGTDFTTEIDYLEFTVLAGVPLPLGERASVHLLAGPALALKLSCRNSATFLGERESEDCGDAAKSMDMGLAGGARLEIGLSDRIGVSLGALYNLGLLNADDSDFDGTVKNRVLALQAGIVLSR